MLRKPAACPGIGFQLRVFVILRIQNHRAQLKQGLFGLFPASFHFRLMRLGRLLHGFSHSRSHLFVGSVDRPARRLGRRRHRRCARTLITIADQLHISLLCYAIFLKGNHILTGVIQLHGIIDRIPDQQRMIALADIQHDQIVRVAPQLKRLSLALFVSEDFRLFQPLEHRADRIVSQLCSGYALRFRTCGRYSRRQCWCLRTSGQ